MNWKVILFNCLSFGKDDPKLNVCFQHKGDRYLSPTIQNEMLQLMSVTIQREISSDIHAATHFTIMADACTDSANNEQLVICFRWMDHKLEVQEDFIGLYSIPDISASTIFSVINDCLMRMNLQWNRCRGQRYDGAANVRSQEWRCYKSFHLVYQCVIQ